MARLIGVDLPREKRLAIALTYIYGVGRSQAAKALQATGIDPSMKAKDLTDDQTLALRDWIEANLKVEGDLRREVAAEERLRSVAAWCRDLPHKLQRASGLGGCCCLGPFRLHVWVQCRPRFAAQLDLQVI